MMDRLDYSGIVQSSWRELLHDFSSGRFEPFEEGDVQCYLYHLILKELRNPLLVHAERPYRIKESQRIPQFIDILVGPCGEGKPGKESVPVEIKVSYLRTWKAIPGSWKVDVKKLAKHRVKRHPIFVLFIIDRRPWNPLTKDLLSQAQLQVIEEFRAWAKEHEGVKVLSPFPE